MHNKRFLYKKLYTLGYEIILEKMENIKENIKLALYGSGCTKDYAEEQTKELLRIIEIHTKSKQDLKNYLDSFWEDYNSSTERKTKLDLQKNMYKELGLE